MRCYGIPSTFRPNCSLIAFAIDISSALLLSQCIQGGPKKYRLFGAFALIKVNLCID